MLVPSSQRPLPLVRRSDLQVSATSLQGEVHFIVKDPLLVRYYLLSLLQYRVLDALNGRRSLTEIRTCLIENGDALAIDLAGILRLILDLADKRLIWSQRTGTATGLWKHFTELRWRQVQSIISNPFYIRLPAWHPGRSLQRFANWFGWIYSPAAVAMALAFVSGTWLFLLLHVESFWRDLPQVETLFNGSGFWSLWIVVGVLKILHEISHGTACERFGGECQSIGVAFLFFSPCLYCDVTDAWMLANKRHRIGISLAGVYVELVISAVNFWLWRFSAPGLFHQVCLQIFLAGSLSTILFNANPLLRFDGYYVLAEVLEIPNLYQRSRLALQQLCGRLLFGLRSSEASPATAQDISLSLICYGLASIGYQLPMLIGIGVFFYSWLEPVGLAVIVWLGMFVACLIQAGRFLNWGQRMIRTQKSTARVLFHSLFGATVSGSMLVSICLCPWRSTVTAPVILERKSLQPVYVETPGTVVQVYVREGDVVEQGTVLAELENLELDRQLSALEGLLTTHETDFRLAQASGDPDLMVMAQTAIDSTSRQIEHTLAERDRLQIRARISGTLISAPTWQREDVLAGTSSADESAGILNPSLIGLPLPRKTCLCEIAPNRLWQAVLWIDQRDRQFLSAGQHVDVRLDAYAGRTVSGNVVSVSAANGREIPATVSESLGSSSFRRTNTQVQTANPVYRAIVALNEHELPVQHGMRGTGRFSRPPQTVGSRVAEEVHRLFVVR